MPLSATLVPEPAPTGVIYSEDEMGASLLLPENAVSMVRGQTKKLTIAVTKLDPTYPDDPTKIRPFNLTGSTLYFTVKRSLKDSIPLLVKTSNTVGQIDVTNAPGGLARLTLEPADTKGWEARVYFMDLVLVSVDEGTVPIVENTELELRPGVTVLP